MRVVVLLGVLVIVAALPVTGFGDVPQQVNYQGYLTDDVGNPLDNDHVMVFSIYDVSSAGTALWWEEQTVSVANGIYNVRIGQDPTGNPFPAGLFDGQRWMGVTVGIDAEMTPRQPLTSTPYAFKAGDAETLEGKTVGEILGNTDGDGLRVSAVNSGVVVESAGSPSTAYNTSISGNGFEVNGAEGYGLYVGRTDLDGVHVASTGDSGVKVQFAGIPSAAYAETGNNGFEVNGAQGYGLYVGRADRDGVKIHSAGFGGVDVNQAGTDGFKVHRAGNPSTTTYSANQNGFEVNGAEGYGLYVGRADVAGMYVESTTYSGVYVGTTSFDGLVVNSAGNDGVRVESAGNIGVRVESAGIDGVNVNSAGNNGVYVNSADGDGFQVHRAGIPSTTNYSTNQNGFVVNGAEGYGLFVGRADMDGVHVESAGGDAGYFGGDTKVTGDLRVDGSIGIGTDTPDYALDVRGDRIQLKEAGGTDWIAMRTDGSVLDFEFEGGNLSIQSTTNGEHVCLNPGRDSNVGIGTWGPTQKLDVDGNARFRSVASGAYDRPLNLAADGTLTTATSDGRLKTNIEPIEDGLAIVDKLQGVRFNWRNNPEGTRKIGLIAQDVEKILPELTFTNPSDGYLGVNYAELSAVLVEAVKAQQQTIENLQHRLEAFEKIKLSEIQTLKEQLASLQNDVQMLIAGKGHSTTVF